jgi:hypothetical protein
MEALAEAPIIRRRGRKPKLGRVDHDGQEASIKLDAIREGVDNLVSLYRAAEEAGTDLSEAIKAVAEKSGLLATVVRKFIAAKAGEQYEERKRQCEQLSLVFEEVG